MPTEKITRRLFNVWAGTVALGQFVMPRLAMAEGVPPPAEEMPPPTDDGERIKYRWLLTMPDRWEWEYSYKDEEGVPLRDDSGEPIVHKYTSYLWTEVLERETINDDDEVKVMLWTPESEQAKADAERFYAAAQRIDFDSPEVHTIGYGPDRPSRRKIPPRTFDRNIPESNFLELDDVELSGTAEGIAAWSGISGRNDEILPNTLNLVPEQVVIEMFVLLENRGERGIGIDAAALRLNTTKGETLSVYPGEPGEKYFYPYVIEYQSEDISEEHRSTITLPPGAHCLLEISFPMKSRLKEDVAMKLCKSIEVPITDGKCDSVVLDKR